MQSLRDARPSHDCRHCDARRPNDDVWQRVRNVALLVRGAHEFYAPAFLFSRESPFQDKLNTQWRPKVLETMRKESIKKP